MATEVGLHTYSPVLSVTRLMLHETAVVSAHVLRTPYSHAPVYSVTSFQHRTHDRQIPWCVLLAGMTADFFQGNPASFPSRKFPASVGDLPFPRLGRTWPRKSARECSYHWWELPQVSFLSQQTQNTSFKTKVCLSRQNFCCDKTFVMTNICCNKSFVATSLLLSSQIHVGHDMTHLLSQQKDACRDKKLLYKYLS